jgi:hypothetical protein
VADDSKQKRSNSASLKIRTLRGPRRTTLARRRPIKEGTGRRRPRLGADGRPSPQQKALPRAGLPRSMQRAQRHTGRRCGRIAGGWGRREAFRMQSRRGVVSSSGLRSLCRCSPDPERRGSPTPQRAIPSFTDGNDYSGAVRRCLSADQPARGMNRASPEWRNVVYCAPVRWTARTPAHATAAVLANRALRCLFVTVRGPGVQRKNSSNPVPNAAGDSKCGTWPVSGTPMKRALGILAANPSANAAMFPLATWSLGAVYFAPT